MDLQSASTRAEHATLPVSLLHLTLAQLRRLDSIPSRAQLTPETFHLPSSLTSVIT